MSDTIISKTQIQIQIRDLDILHDACNELGLTLDPDAECRGFAGGVRKASHVIKLKGPIDIAVDLSSENNGTYDLITDWRGGHVAKEVGVGFGRLLQSYGIQEAIRYARARGVRVIRRTRSDGSVLLTLKWDSNELPPPSTI